LKVWLETVTETQVYCEKSTCLCIFTRIIYQIQHLRFLKILKISSGNVPEMKSRTSKANSTDRKANMTNNEATSIQGAPILRKDSHREECSGKTVFYNVGLKGGLTANSFRRYPGVTSMESCLGHCCRLSDCDLALIKNGDCFAVHCSTREMCKVTDGVGEMARVWRRTFGEFGDSGLFVF
jgi:hypothetical protein